MKKILAIAIVIAMNATVFAEFDGVSFRMQGINPELSGIVADEYTDVMSGNIADITAVSGWRYYTQMSNLSNKDDAAFDGDSATTGDQITDDVFQFGFIGDPLKSVLPDSKLGLLYEVGSAVDAGTPLGMTGTYDNLGKISDTNVIRNDADSDGTFTTTNDVTTTTTFTGKRLIETSSSDISALFGMPLGDALTVGARIRSQMENLEEPIEGTFDYSQETYGAINTDTENSAMNLKEKENESSISIELGGRYQISDSWDVGAAVSMSPVKWELKRSGSVTRNQDVSAGGGANPTTLSATGTDMTEIDALVAGAGGHFATNDALAGSSIRPGGGGSAYTTRDGVANPPLVPGIDEDAVGSLKDDGQETGIMLDTHYMLNDDITLVGAVTIANTPLDRKLSATNNANCTIVSYDAVSSNQTYNDTKTETYSGSGDCKENYMSVAIGAEQKLPSNVKLGYGIIYSKTDEDDSCAYTVSKYRQTTLDLSGDGLTPGATGAEADTRVTTTSNESFKSQEKTETTDIEIPIGLELQVTKKLKLRLGATHLISDTVTKSKAKVVDSSVINTLTETGGAPSARTYANPASNLGDIVEYSEVEDVTRTTTYYYGAGYQWNENLSFDILNFSGDNGGTGAGLLDISAWRIGMTLMFGGEEM